MADKILSLSKARKARARVEKEATAEANRIRFGRTKAEREKDEAIQALEARKIDGHKREE